MNMDVKITFKSGATEMFFGGEYNASYEIDLVWTTIEHYSDGLELRTDIRTENIHRIDVVKSQSDET